jgi:hypothetical protein
MWPHAQSHMLFVHHYVPPLADSNHDVSVGSPSPWTGNVGFDLANAIANANAYFVAHIVDQLSSSAQLRE